MNASNSTTNATVYNSAAALVAATETLLRRIGHSEVGNDALSCVVADMVRIGSVLSGRALNASTQPAAPAPLTFDDGTAVPHVEPAAPAADDVVADDEPAAPPVAPKCSRCNDTGRVRCAGREGYCRKCDVGARAKAQRGETTVTTEAPAPLVATVAANSPVAVAPAVNVNPVNGLPDGYTIRAVDGIMRGCKNYVVTGPNDYESERHVTLAEAVADAYATAGIVQPKPAPRKASANPAQPLRQGTSSAPLTPPATPAPQSNVKAAPVSANGHGKPTPVAPAPNATSERPASKAQHKHYATVARHFDTAGELGGPVDQAMKLLRVSCVLIGAPATVNRNDYNSMLLAIAEWLSANDGEANSTVATSAPAAPAPQPAAPATVKASNGGLSKTDRRVLTALTQVNEPIGYRRIEALTAERNADGIVVKNGVYGNATAVCRSLTQRGFIETYTIDGSFAFAITANGRTALVS